MHGKLFERIPGSKAPHQKEWKNVATHCLNVGRALHVLGDMLGLSHEDREKIVHVGLVHDWNKRLQKNPESFTDQEKKEAEAHVKKILDTYDPDGLLLRSTEPEGLARLEGSEASDLEHYIRLIDLSTMPMGVVPTKQRIDNLRKRQKHLNNHPDYPRFWDRKEELTAKEEGAILEKLRERGMNIPEGTKLCDLLNERLKSNK
jgi:hypothetical protein